MAADCAHVAKYICAGGKYRHAAYLVDSEQEIRLHCKRHPVPTGDGMAFLTVYFLRLKHSHPPRHFVYEKSDLTIQKSELRTHAYLKGDTIKLNNCFL